MALRRSDAICRLVSSCCSSSENVVEPMRNHDVASSLTAVRNDRVLYGGVTYQGPIFHLFQLEEAARGVYPDVFGGERLFDRQRVADIVNGEFRS